MRRRGLLGVVVALCVALSGCGGLPTSGPVREGLAVGAPPVEPVRVLPDGPAAGATPEQIVRGFLRAAAGFDDDHAISRSFLMSSVAQNWLPDVGVMVYDGESALRFENVDDHTVRVTGTMHAAIDASGRYRDLPAGTQAQATFSLARVGGQWRISETSKDFGLWLLTSDLERLYRPFAVHYVAASGSAPSLIPDVRWFPLTAGLATSLARAQLDPVPAYLQGAATTGVPEGTRLSVDAVPVESGQANVDLSVRGLATDPRQRRAMWAQFIATLTQAPSVQSVSLKVGGNKVAFPGVPAAPSSLVQVGFPDDGAPAPTSVVLRQGSVLRRLDPARLGGSDDGHRLPPGPGGELPGIPAGWNALALSRDGAEVAGVAATRDRLARWRGGRMTVVPRFAGNLTRPAYDGRGGLWVGGLAGGAGKVFVLDPGADTTAPRALDVPWLAGRRLVSLRVSPDDQRVVMVSTGPTGADARVDVVGVVRAANGQVRSLAPPLRVAPTLTSAADASWVDGRTVSVLGSAGATDPLRPYLAGIGSGITPLAPVPGAVSVTGTGGPRGVVVVTDRGEILTRAGNGWVVESKGSDLLVPGG